MQKALFRQRTLGLFREMSKNQVKFAKRVIPDRDLVTKNLKLLVLGKMKRFERSCEVSFVKDSKVNPIFIYELRKNEVLYQLVMNTFDSFGEVLELYNEKIGHRVHTIGFEDRVENMCIAQKRRFGMQL